MKRAVVAMAAAAVMAIGGVTAAGATTLLDEQTPTQWVCPGFSGVAGNHNPAGNPSFARVAEKLGMSADALASEVKAGKSVAEIASARKVDLQAVVDTLIAPRKDMMAIRVKYGFMTQAQADAAIDSMAAAVKGQLAVKGAFGGAMMGGRGMMGGMMGGFGPMMGGRPGAGAGPATGANPGFGPGMMGGRGMMGGFWPNRTN